MSDENYSTLNPLRVNTERQVLAKILLSLNGGGSGASTGVMASGTDDPNTLTLGTNVLFYEQFDGSNAPVATWTRKDSSSTWYVTVQNQSA